MINVAELIAQRLGEGNARPDEPRVRPVMEAQRMELLSRYADYHDDTGRPDPGDLVVEKPGMGSLKKELKPITQLMLWRMLDPGDPMDWVIIEDWTKNHLTNGVDCIVAHVCDDGAHIVFMPHQRAQLRRLPNEAAS